MTDLTTEMSLAEGLGHLCSLITPGLAALSWMLDNIVIGSVGGTLAESMVLVTNIITIIRLYRLQEKYPDLETNAMAAKQSE